LISPTKFELEENNMNGDRNRLNYLKRKSLFNISVGVRNSNGSVLGTFNNQDETTIESSTKMLPTIK